MTSPLPNDPINTDGETSDHDSDYLSSTSTEKALMASTPPAETKSLGNPNQQYALKLANALSKFSVNTKLKEGGYTLWYRPVYEAVRGLGFHNYLIKDNFQDPSISEEDHVQTRFLISTWILGQCEPDEAERARDEMSINNPVTEQSDEAYDPYRLWKNLESHHHEITEEKLLHIDQALHSFKQHRSDDLRTHIAKFTALLNDFYKYRGEMSTSQAAGTLIKSLKPGHEVTVKMIYRTISPLTFLSVKRELLKSQDEDEFLTPSMAQANMATASHSEANASQDRSCTVEKCVGHLFKTPHSSHECFKKPENFDNRDLWIANKEELRKKKNKKGKGSVTSATNLRGLKKLTRPEASNSMLTFHTSFEPSNFNLEFESMTDSASETDSYTTAIEVYIDEAPLDDVTFESACQELFDLEIKTAFKVACEDLGAITVNETGKDTEHPVSLRHMFASYQLACLNIFEEIDPTASHSHQQSNNEKWGLKDTGASHHMFNTVSFFVPSTLRRIEDPNKRLRLAGGNATLAVHSVGTVKLKAGDGSVFQLRECLYVPELSKNLIAAGALIKQGVVTILNEDDKECFAMIKGDLVLFNGVFCGNLMLLGLEPVSLSDISEEKSNFECANGCDLQHRRLGHLNQNYIKRMETGNSVKGICGSPGPITPCIVCAQSKGRRLPFSGTRPRATNFLQNVHVDLSGINRVKGILNKQYYILFVDDYSTFCHIFSLTSKCKEEVYSIFVEYLALVERQTSRKIVQYTLDNGSEFINTMMDEYCKELGINLHKTAPYTPQQNGVVERMNQTVVNMARAMMIQSGVPLEFWYLAVSTAVYLRNRSITTALKDGITAYEMWNFRKPSVNHLKVFGCLAHRLIRKELRNNKYSPVTSSGVMIGYTEENFNFQIFDLESKKVIVTHDVIFFEDSFPFLSTSPAPEEVLKFVEDEFTKSQDERTQGTTEGQLSFNKDSGEDEEGEDTTSDSPSALKRADNSQEVLSDTSESNDPSPQTTKTVAHPSRRSKRDKQPVDYRGMEAKLQTSHFESFVILDEGFEAAVVEIATPKSFKNAMQSDEKDKWKIACDKEMNSLTSKNVWDLVERPKDKRVLRGFWIFRVKPMPHGQPYKYKSCFVVMGNMQEEGIDFHETFSPTGKPSSLRLLIAIASIHGWEIHQMDAVTAFLNGDLDEEIFMEQPEGYRKLGQERMVCKLNKSPYGL